MFKLLSSYLMLLLPLLLLTISIHFSECHYYLPSHNFISQNSNVSCPNGTYWIITYFGECVQTTLQYVAFIIGLFSILFWLFAQLPQLIQNFRTGKADEALSPLFLLQWLGGDLTNLVGAVLTGQLTTQIATAIYFVSMDAVLLTQYCYYLLKNKRHEFRGYIRLGSGKPLYIIVLFAGMFIFGKSVYPMSSNTPLVGQVVHSRSLLSTRTNVVVDTRSWEDILGYILGCISALLYLCSRVPQIVKNFRRKSTYGLSLPMFIMAVMGNLTYGLGILLYSVDKIFILQKLPWLIGSIGTLCFDFTIFVQFIIFPFWKNSQEKSGSEASEGGADHHHSIQKLID